MSQIQDELSLVLPPLSSSTANISHRLTTEFLSSSGETYSALCHRPSAIDLFAKEDLACFTVQQASHKSFTQTLAFKHGMRDDWVSTSLGVHHHNTPTLFTDESGVSFQIDSGKPLSDAHAIGQMKNGKWIAYAARALVIRFWDLAKVRLLTFFFTKLILLPLTESRLTRYPLNFSWLHSNAHNLLSPPPSFPKPRLIIQAPISYNFLGSPRLTPCATYCDGFENSNRSCCIDGSITVSGLHCWV
jgi:hypothetical protein